VSRPPGANTFQQCCSGKVKVSRENKHRHRLIAELCDHSVVPKPILEVIALNVADARAAQDGGADRIELVADMAQGGLTPDIATFAAVRDAVDLPVRVMLRDASGYALSDATGLTAQAAALRKAGADQFVLGFLDSRGAVDAAALALVLEPIAGCRWTFHRALDHAADRSAAWRALRGLPGPDFVLTAGGPGTVADGIGTLTAEAAGIGAAGIGAAGTGPRLLAGGGLRAPQVAPLRAAGIDAFHTGSAVRPGGRWAEPVSADLVRAWREHVDQPVAAG
jgi:copper homeostasis protein